MILELLKKRCSVRKFLPKDIPNSVLGEMLEAGRLSPSGGNEQPWVFGVITDDIIINQLADIAYNQSWIETAPLLIVLCTVVVADEKGARNIQERRFPRYKSQIDRMEKSLYANLNLEEHQTKIPGTHMVLCALEHGIYSTWISYFDVEKASELLKLPKGIIPSEIIAFGYPNSEPQVRSKKSVEEISFINFYKE